MLFATTLDAYTSRAKNPVNKALHPPIFRLCERLIFQYSTGPAANIDSELWASILSSLAAALTAYIETTDSVTHATCDQVEYWDACATYTNSDDRRRQMARMLVHWIRTYILPANFDFASDGPPQTVAEHWAAVYRAFPESDRADVPEGTLFRSSASNN